MALQDHPHGLERGAGIQTLVDSMGAWRDDVFVERIRKSAEDEDVGLKA